MKIKKPLLVFLSCVLMITTTVTGVFAAETQLTAETDGVAKHYEVNASNKQGSTLVDGYYNVNAHNFCDVGDTSTIIITDYEDGEYATSNYFTEFNVNKMDASHPSVDASIIQEFGPLPAHISLNLGFKVASSVNVNTGLSETYSYLLNINGTSYVMDAKEKNFVASNTPKAIYINDTNGLVGTVTIGLDNYNAILGTNIITKITSMSDTIDLSNAALNKIDFVLYKNGTKVETLNLANVHTNKIHSAAVSTHTMHYKLNADGSVLVTTPVMVGNTIYAYYSHQPNIGVDISSTSGYYNNDGTYTVPADVMSDVNKLEIEVRLMKNDVPHTYRAIIDTTNIAAILEYYKISNINPDDIPDIKEPEDTEDEKPSGGLIVEVPKDNESTENNNQITDNKENDTTTGNNEETTTKDENTDVSTEVKDVTLTDDNKVISTDDMSILITENATKDVVIKTPAGITLTFAKGTMKVVDGKDTYDFGVSMSNDYSKQSNMGDVTKDNFVSLIDFEYSGNLPAEATIKIPVGADRAGQTLYYLLKTETGYTLIQSAKVDDEGYITVKQDHCSTYVVATEDVSNSISSDDNTVDNSTSIDTDKDNSSNKPNEHNEPKETKDSSNWYIYVIIVVVIIAIAGVVVFIVYKKKKEEPQDN